MHGASDNSPLHDKRSAMTEQKTEEKKKQKNKTMKRYKNTQKLITKQSNEKEAIKQAATKLRKLTFCRIKI